MGGWRAVWRRALFQRLKSATGGSAGLEQGCAYTLPPLRLLFSLDVVCWYCVLQTLNCLLFFRTHLSTPQGKSAHPEAIRLAATDSTLGRVPVCQINSPGFGNRTEAEDA